MIAPQLSWKQQSRVQRVLRRTSCSKQVGVRLLYVRWQRGTARIRPLRCCAPCRNGSISPAGRAIAAVAHVGTDRRTDGRTHTIRGHHHYTGWQLHNFVPYLCHLIFAAILYVKLWEMFVAVIALKYALLVLVSQWSYGHFLIQLIQFYLNNTKNLRRLTQRIMSCYTHRMATVSWP